MGGDVLWLDLGAALALVLVLEGLMPLLSPTTAKRVAATMLALEPQAVRTVGGISVAVGFIALYAVRG
jgi:hypothetical protein